MVDLEDFSSRLKAYPHQLSGGQKQRVMIAIALANNPKILIADEPTTALDVVVQNEILNLILRLKNELGLSVLFISHNLRAVSKIADEVIEMEDGKIGVSTTTPQPPLFRLRPLDYAGQSGGLSSRISPPDKGGWGVVVQSKLFTYHLSQQHKIPHLL
jgi:ABC-type microcin C transport system duplicated ATPase subunit YejF